MIKNKSALRLHINDNFFHVINMEKRKSIHDTSITLLKHKIFLEKILHLIKISQMESFGIIAQNQNLKGEKQKSLIRIIKELLKNMRKDLIITLKGNTESKAKIQNKMNNTKSKLVKSIFDFERENINNTDLETDISTDNGMTTERKIKNKKKMIENKYFKYKVELPHLKLLNFKIENQLECMKIKIKILLESKKKFYVFCHNQNDLNEASETLHQDLIKMRNLFKLMVKEKENQNNYIKILRAQIASLRDEIDFIKSKNNCDYVNTSDIINEDSMEYYTKTNTNTNVYTFEKCKHKNKNYKNYNKDIEIIHYDFIKDKLIKINNY